jgi:hypothetical protein
LGLSGATLFLRAQLATDRTFTIAGLIAMAITQQIDCDRQFGNRND